MIKNKYLRWYIKLIRLALSRTTPTQYTEKHHVFPLSIFGNKKTNKFIVELTGREHYIAHMFLYRIFLHRYGKKDKRTLKMLRAIACMIYSKNKEKLTSGEYEISRQAMSSVMKENHPKPFQNKTFTEEHKRNLSESIKKSYQNRPPKIYSEEEIERRRKGWYNIPEEKRDEMAKRKSGIYEITFTSGETLIVTGLSKWLKKNGYNESGLNQARKENRPYRDILSVVQIGGKKANISKISVEGKKRISEARKNYQITDETRKKISEGGRGRKQSEHQKNIIKNLKSCEWKLTHSNGTIEYITNLTEWCRVRGIQMENIITNGKSKGIEVKAERISERYRTLND